RLAETMRIRGIEVVAIGPCIGPLSWHPGIGSPLKNVIQEADVVHVHAVWEQVQHEASVTAFREGVPYVITPHGMLDPWSLGQKSVKKKLYMAWRLRRNLDRAASIHFLSDVERDLTEPLGLKAAKIVEPNGVELAEFDPLPPANTFRARYQLGDRPIVLFMGRLHPKKGLDLLIPAFAQAAPKEAALVIAGPGSREYVEKVHALIHHNGLGERTLLPGMLYGQDRIAALTDADLFVLPSYQEAAPIAVIESLAAGTPVVISDRINICDQIANAAVGGVVTPNIPALSKELSNWLGDADRRQRASLKARAFVSEHYDWNRIARCWIDHYGRLAKKA
ncbi:MAG: glycosyltransferase, partial [Pyrinomonadaceae bacterium]